MAQQDTTAKMGMETGTGTSTSADSYLTNLRAYRDQIEQISKLINSSPQWELASDYDKVKSIDKQIADAIDNLIALSGNPLGEAFDKGKILKNLTTARVELNKASRLAASKDEQVQILCFDHIVACWDYLNLTKDLMSSF